MADAKISALTASTTPLAGTEVLPIVQSGVTKQVSVANLTTGRAISASELTLTTGNLIVASGQGIDFSATPGTGTSELLNDYEEGNWTPDQGAGLTVVGAFQSWGVYTKVGRVVTLRGVVLGATSISCSSAGAICSNLPFASSADTAGSYFNGTLSGGGQIDAAGNIAVAVGAIGLTSGIYFAVTYQV